ncbi:MAG TPA: FAD/NAD(P)-binding oxidoreductase [Gemmatimonadales bacterium]|nr:FAD/NAD(P)-binding oxidoreductase [Gemmatimonadales bacterium]
MPERRTVLVLGGGVGGVTVATRLGRLFDDCRVVLVDREEHHLFQPSLLWLLVGRRRAEQIRRPLDCLQRRGIEVVRGEIEEIDPRARSVRVSGRAWTGDALVVGLGADLAAEQIPGLVDAGHDIYTLEGARTARDALQVFRNGRIVVLTAAPAYKCPAAPYEAAMLIEADLRHRRLPRPATIDVYAAEPAPMGVAGPHVSAAVRGMLEQRSIGYHPEHQVSSVDPSARRISFANGAVADYDLLMFVPPHRAPAVVRQSPLAGETGWIPVNRHTLETGFPSVFAIGDVTVIPLAVGKPLPKAGVFAHAQADVVARNLAHAWLGTGAPVRFDGHGACFLEAGDGRAGYGSGNFYAEPAPQVRLRSPNRWWHLGKVAFEKRWLRGLR